jgi:hypothetical protein
MVSGVVEAINFVMGAQLHASVLSKVCMVLYIHPPRLDRGKALLNWRRTRELPELWATEGVLSQASP